MHTYYTHVMRGVYATNALNTRNCFNHFNWTNLITWRIIQNSMQKNKKQKKTPTIKKYLKIESHVRACKYLEALEILCFNMSLIRFESYKNVCSSGFSFRNFHFFLSLSPSLWSFASGQSGQIFAISNWKTQFLLKEIRRKQIWICHNVFLIYI